MREIIINRIKLYGRADYSFERGDKPHDKNGKPYKEYEDWLRASDDEDLLAAYDRVRDEEVF